MIANHMRKDYQAWNKDGIDDRKIADDLYELSEGKLQLTTDIFRLMENRQVINRRPRQNTNTNQRRGHK